MRLILVLFISNRLRAFNNALIVNHSPRRPAKSRKPETAEGQPRRSSGQAIRLAKSRLAFSRQGQITGPENNAGAGRVRLSAK